MGAAVALPIAVSRDPAVAAGCLWFGLVGGQVPDWLDLRSDFRTSLRLRHRGASHGLFAVVVLTTVLWVMLDAIQRAHVSFGQVTIDPTDASISAWVLALGAGMVSHLALDACTYSGIRPLLPFSQWRCWLLPRILRSRYDGYLDVVFRLVAIVVLAFGLIVAFGRWLDLA
jgi:membrane-bound metal-dependent hydrolase YbcI (DUF457 family)